MESKKINQLATELTPQLSDLTIIGDPTTGISRKITLSQMASLFTGTVEEYPNLASFPLVGAADTIYIAIDTNVIYRWTGSAYVELSPNIINSLVFSDANGFDGTITLVGSVATLTITTALTLGSLPFIGASGALIQDNANLFFDDANNRLGIGTNTPTTPLDVFGLGIIARVNGTSTNNAFLGFGSDGTNRWSIGNVQSDQRFRLYNEATASEVLSILSTGEFGIGIANPTTKLHLDGGATALIANLDANVSIAKSISFRSDNSNRINLEVSGTESGSNAGANIFLRTFTDAGALLETPLNIVRSTGVTTLKSLTLTNALAIANGGTGSATQNFVDLTTAQTIGGAKTLTAALLGTSGTFSGNTNLATTSGVVGIGTASPVAGYKLEVQSAFPAIFTATSDTTTSNYGGVSFKRNTKLNGNGNGFEFSALNSSDATAEYGYFGSIIESNTASAENGTLVWMPTVAGARTEGMRLNSAGDLTIRGSNATKASGTAWINPSDERLKGNIQPYTKGLKELLLINPKVWNYNEASGISDTTTKHVSPIAQELAEVMPEMVGSYKGELSGKETTLYNVDGSDYVMLLINAVKELEARIKILESK